MLKKLSLLFLLLLFIAPCFAKNIINNNKTDTLLSAAPAYFVNWDPYTKKLITKIKNNWHPSKEDRTKKVVAIVKIDRSGKLLNVEITKSSGSKKADNEVISAIKSSAPFNPLPKKHTVYCIIYKLTFDGNISGYPTNSDPSATAELMGF